MKLFHFGRQKRQATTPLALCGSQRLSCYRLSHRAKHIVAFHSFTYKIFMGSLPRATHFSRGWGFSSDKETGVSACKQLPILVGETDNITIDEVPRMVQGCAHNGKEAEEGEVQDAGSSQVASGQGSKAVRSTVGRQVCRAEWPGETIYAYLKRSKETSASGPL